MSRHAQTPPMGWNSWDSYGTTVTQDEVLANARVLAERLLPHGWDTVVVDIDWYDPAARAHGYNDGSSLVLDAFGRQLPAENRFPSAAGGRGFGPLADAVHALGLRFGVHLMRGIPRIAVEQDLPVEGTALDRARRRRHHLGLPVERRQLRARPRPPGRAGVPRRPGRAAGGLGRRLPQGRRHARAVPPGRGRGVGAGDRALRPGHRPVAVARHPPVHRPRRPPARARPDVADLRRPLGPLGGRARAVRAARPVGTVPAARRLGRRRHAAARPHRPARRARRRPAEPAHPRRAAHDPHALGAWPARR